MKFTSFFLKWIKGIYWIIRYPHIIKYRVIQTNGSDRVGTGNTLLIEYLEARIDAVYRLHVNHLMQKKIYHSDFPNEISSCSVCEGMMVASLYVKSVWYYACTNCQTLQCVLSDDLRKTSLGDEAKNEIAKKVFSFANKDTPEGLILEYGSNVSSFVRSGSEVINSVVAPSFSTPEVEVTLDAISKKFEVIICSDMIGRVSNSSCLVRLLSKYLSQTGYIYIATPVVDKDFIMDYLNPEEQRDLILSSKGLDILLVRSKLEVKELYRDDSGICIYKVGFA